MLIYFLPVFWKDQRINTGLQCPIKLFCFYTKVGTQCEMWIEQHVMVCKTLKADRKELRHPVLLYKDFFILSYSFCDVMSCGNWNTPYYWHIVVVSFTDRQSPLHSFFFRKIWTCNKNKKVKVTNKQNKICFLYISDNCLNLLQLG